MSVMERPTEVAMSLPSLVESPVIAHTPPEADPAGPFFDRPAVTRQQDPPRVVHPSLHPRPWSCVDPTEPYALQANAVEDKTDSKLAQSRSSGDVASSMRDVASRFESYLLVCHARSLSILEGIWCFSLETVEGKSLLEVESEDAGDLNRLSLLAAVRGLEAIDGNGCVSLISNNRYLIRSLDQALPRWRDNDFVWEHFGRKMPVQNADLWRRIDRALTIHDVTASLLHTTRVSGGDASRLSSSSKMAADANDGGPSLRIDSPHPVATPPSDGLRRWLVGTCDSAPAIQRRGRYLPADLLAQ